MRESHCSVAMAASVLGDAWTILIVRELFLGNHRFEDIQAQTGASSTTVSARLKHLIHEGIVQRAQYNDNPPRSEFRLTRKGAELWPVIVTIMQWGDRWLRGRSQAPLQIEHGTCGHTEGYKLVCRHCGDAPDVSETRPVLSRSLDHERASRKRAFERSIGRRA